LDPIFEKKLEKRVSLSMSVRGMRRLVVASLAPILVLSFMLRYLHLTDMGNLTPFPYLRQPIRVEATPMLASRIKYHQDCSSWASIPIASSLESYIVMHKKCKDEVGMKYLIYSCGNHMVCGGTGDRVRGIVTTLLYAIKTRRIFLVEWNYPFPLETHFIWKSINWTSPFLDQKPDFNFIGIIDSCEEDRFEKVLNASAIGIRLMTNCYYSEPYRHALIKEIWNKTVVDLQDVLNSYTSLLHEIFVPTERLKQKSKEMANQAGFEIDVPYTGIHIRLGRTSTENPFNDPVRHGLNEINSFIDCAKRLNDQYGLSQQYFVATDSASARDQLKNKSVHLLPLQNAFHIDRSETNETNAYHRYENTLVELFLLINATCVVMSDSGFSYLPVIFGLKANQKNCFASARSCRDPTKDNLIELFLF